MRSPVVTVASTATIRQATAAMIRGKLRHLPVVDSGRLVGIVTDRDLRQAMFAPIVQERLGVTTDAVDDIPVREVMTWAVLTVRPGTDLREAARLMHEQKIGAVPVVEGERVVGILTESDVLAALTEVLQADVTTVHPLAVSPATEPYEYGFSDAEPADTDGR